MIKCEIRLKMFWHRICVMNGQIFRCCKKTPKFSIIYSVNGSEKEYQVCSDCINLECFSKYIIRKVLLHNVYRKKFQNEISDETVENEIINGKTDEVIEQNENLTEHNEKDSHSQLVLKNKESEKL